MDIEEAKKVLSRAHAAFVSEKYDIAAGLYQEYIDLVPRDRTALLNYSRVLIMMSQITESKSEKTELNLKSIALCKNYIEINRDGDSYLGHYQLGISYFKIGEYSEATGSYLAALYFQPNDPAALKGLGSTYFQMGEFEKSEKCYRQSLEADSNDGQAWYDLGRILLKTSSKQAAKDAFKRAVEIDPENTRWQASYRGL